MKKCIYIIISAFFGTLLSCQDNHWETFKAMEYIRTVVFKTMAPDAPEESTHRNRQWLSNRKTTRGLYLLTDGAPKSLTTPWGEIRLDNASGKIKLPKDDLKDFVVFKNMLKLEFVENFGEPRLGHRLIYSTDKLKFKVITPELEAVSIDAKDVPSYCGSDMQILTNILGYYSVYKVKSVNGIELDHPAWLQEEIDDDINAQKLEQFITRFEKEGKNS